MISSPIIFSVDEAWLSISAMIAILGILAYFFGKIVLRTETNGEDQYEIYVNGGFYLLLFVLLPVLILSQLPKFSFGLVNNFLILIVCTIYLDAAKNINKVQLDAGQQNNTLEAMKRDKTKRDIAIFGVLGLNTILIWMIDGLDFSRLDIVNVSSIIAAFGGVTLGAFIFGWLYSRKTKIKIYIDNENGKTYQLIKRFSDHIVVTQGNKLTYINTAKISKFEIEKNE